MVGKTIKTVIKVRSEQKSKLERLTPNDFPKAFKNFREGSRSINETKTPKWMDTK